MTTPFPFTMPMGPMGLTEPMGSGREAEALETWMKPGRQAFEFWVSFFPTAPLFGVEWRFASMADPAANPFMMPGIIPGMPGMRAAGLASHPGELDSPAAADEDAAKPVARAADKAGDAATDMARVAGETGKAAARTAGTALKAGADAAKATLDAEARALDVAEETSERVQRATETAMTAAEDAATTAEIAAEETAKRTANTARQASRAGTETAEKATDAAETAARKGAEAAEETAGKATDNAGAAARKGAKATEETAGKAAGAAEAATRKGTKAAEDTAEAVDHAIAAAPKPKMLLDKRPKETDDLTSIKGVGPALARQLNDLGLYRFDQLAKMSDTDLAWIDANITRFKGRCYRDDWVGQAKSRLSN